MGIWKRLNDFFMIEKCDICGKTDTPLHFDFVRLDKLLPSAFVEQCNSVKFGPWKEILACEKCRNKVKSQKSMKKIIVHYHPCIEDELMADLRQYKMSGRAVTTYEGEVEKYV